MKQGGRHVVCRAFQVEGEGMATCPAGARQVCVELHWTVETSGEGGYESRSGEPGRHQVTELSAVAQPSKATASKLGFSREAAHTFREET